MILSDFMVILNVYFDCLECVNGVLNVDGFKINNRHYLTSSGWV